MRLAPLWLGVLVGCLSTASLNNLCCGDTVGSDKKGNAAASLPLDERIAESMTLKDRPFLEAVFTLLDKLCFRYSIEYSASDTDNCNPRIDLITLDGVTLRTALDVLVAKAPGWRWRADEGVVNFIYGKLDSAPDWPLNKEHAVVKIKSARYLIARNLKEYIPELVIEKWFALDPFELRTRGASEPTFQLEKANLRNALNRFVTSPEYTSRGVFYSWRFYRTAQGSYHCEVRYENWQQALPSTAIPPD